MSVTQLFTAEQIGFLTEVMNIGAGNAAAALEQMLERPVNLSAPRVHVVPTREASWVLGNPTTPVIGVRMGMRGDITGEVFFIIPQEHHEKLVHFMEQGTLRSSRGWCDTQEGETTGERILSTLSEIANVVSGVYFTAIRDFCGLNSNHTVPVAATDMAQAILDETLAKLSVEAESVVIVENEFTIDEQCVRSYLVILPSSESAIALVNSIGRAEMAYRRK